MSCEIVGGARVAACRSVAAMWLRQSYRGSTRSRETRLSTSSRSWADSIAIRAVSRSTGVSRDESFDGSPKSASFGISSASAMRVSSSSVGFGRRRTEPTVELIVEPGPVSSIFHARSLIPARRAAWRRLNPSCSRRSSSKRPNAAHWPASRCERWPGIAVASLALRSRRRRAVVGLAWVSASGSFGSVSIRCSLRGSTPAVRAPGAYFGPTGMALQRRRSRPAPRVHCRYEVAPNGQGMRHWPPSPRSFDRESYCFMRAPIPGDGLGRCRRPSRVRPSEERPNEPDEKDGQWHVAPQPRGLRGWTRVAECQGTRHRRLLQRG